MNRKGFMMAEVVVVSVIVLTVLTSLYLSYNKIYSSYKTLSTYYDVTTLLHLGNIRNELINNNRLNNLIFSTNEAETIEDKEVYFIKLNNEGIISTTSINGINKTFSDYLTYIHDSVKLEGATNILVMERCINNDKDKCYYGYLEIYS